MTTHLKRAYGQMEALKDEKLVDASLDLHFKEVYCNSLEKPEKPIDGVDVAAPVEIDCSKYNTDKDIKLFKIKDKSYHSYKYQLDVEGRVVQDKIDWIRNLVVQLESA